MEKFNSNIIEKNSYNPLQCTELLKNFEEKEVISFGNKLNFSGVNNSDVYNISAPFNIGNKIFISGRVENRNAWANSQVMFFEENEGTWYPSKNTPTLPLEDGFFVKIKNEIIIGGVEVYPEPTKIDPDGIGYRTAFYKGEDLYSLQKFTTGPDRMKDIRLVSLLNNKIGVFTRPQGGKNEGGRIGFTEIDKFDDLNANTIINAKIIENQFASNEWGGANELHFLKDNKIGVLGHIAYKDIMDDRHYYAIVFVYDIKTNKSSPIEIIATRQNFPKGDSKIPELSDVIFPGGLLRHGDGTATLYVGLSDAEAGSIILHDPFDGM
jgi:hypothetical protein